MPASPRLRERYATLGPHGLGPVELLALILGTGTAGRSARAIAADLLDSFGDLTGLRTAPVSALSRVHGMGPARAIRVHAALALAGCAPPDRHQAQLDHPAALVAFLQPHLRHEPVETFWVVPLDRRLHARDCRLISRGSRRCTVVDPGEVFRVAVASRADAVVVAHNHPSGTAEPSAEDRSLTARLVRGGQLLGVPVLDHIIVAGDRHWSFAEHGELPMPVERASFSATGSGPVRPPRA